MKELKFGGKKLLAAILAGTMILSLCACDEEDWEDDYEDEPGESEIISDDPDETGSYRSLDASAMQMSVSSRCING